MTVNVIHDENIDPILKNAGKSGITGKEQRIGAAFMQQYGYNPPPGQVEFNADERLYFHVQLSPEEENIKGMAGEEMMRRIQSEEKGKIAEALKKEADDMAYKTEKAAESTIDIEAYYRMAVSKPSYYVTGKSMAGISSFVGLTPYKETFNQHECVNIPRGFDERGAVQWLMDNYLEGGEFRIIQWEQDAATLTLVVTYEAQQHLTRKPAKREPELRGGKPAFDWIA
jgi:hypothetical protein